MYTTSNFSACLIQSIITFISENKVDTVPLSFLASNKYGFPETAKLAQLYIEKGHWDYFYVKNGKLCLHKKYNGYMGFDDCDYEISDKTVCFDTMSEVFGNRHIMNIMTADLVNLVHIVYDTIGNVHFTKGVETFDITEIDELEKEYEARRNEV